MTILEIIFYIISALVLYVGMRGLDGLFKKKNILCNPQKTAFEAEQTPIRTFLAAALVGLVFAIVFLGVASYRGVFGQSGDWWSPSYIPNDPILFFGMAWGEGIGLIVLGWIVSFPFRHIYRKVG